MFPAIPTIFHIAPNTTNVTSAKTNEVSSLSLMKTFTLQRVKMLHYRERRYLFLHFNHASS
jgi:hypothetical protein